MHETVWGWIRGRGSNGPAAAVAAGGKPGGTGATPSRLRILLIAPAAPGEPPKPRGRRPARRTAPPALGLLAALVPKELGATVVSVDEAVEPLPPIAGFDLVGISVNTATARRAYRLAAGIRAAGVPVVLGGIHVTLLPKEAVHHADAIVSGNAEQSWPHLLRDFRRGVMKRWYHDPLYDPAATPAPVRHTTQRRSYLIPDTVAATRGCQGSCDSCSAPAVCFRRRCRPVADVVSEIRALPGKRFMFSDVSLCDDRAHARELFAAIAPLHRRWSLAINCRVAADEELVADMARAGCESVTLAVGAPCPCCQETLPTDPQELDRIREAIRRLHRHGIAVRCVLAVGADGDTAAAIATLPERIRALGIDVPEVRIFTPYPGSPVHGRLAAAGRILTRVWSRYDGRTAVFRPTAISAEDLAEAHRAAVTAVHALPEMLRRAAASPHPAIVLAENLFAARDRTRAETRLVPPAVPVAAGTPAAASPDPSC